MLYPGDMVAELATAKIFLAKGGVAITLVANKTFFDGTSRSQVMKLLRYTGNEVRDAVATAEELFDVAAVWSTGNCAKVVPVIRTKDRKL
ncbi:aminotransferase class IV [Alphaproteobacteria bacterium]|nr:aminotransferase class IV [Alphaproteobacteria bacterium]